MRRNGVFLPTSCSSHLLSALQQKIAQSNLLYLFYYIEYVNSPRIAFNFQNKLFSKVNNNVVSMLHTLKKHATITQSEALLDCFK